MTGGQNTSDDNTITLPLPVPLKAKEGGLLLAHAMSGGVVRRKGQGGAHFEYHKCGMVAADTGNQEWTQQYVEGGAVS